VVFLQRALRRYTSSLLSIRGRFGRVTWRLAGLAPNVRRNWRERENGSFASFSKLSVSLQPAELRGLLGN